MLESFQQFQSFFIFMYVGILLYMNISYLFDYKKIRERLKYIDVENIDIKAESFAVTLFALVFDFFRSWLFYLIAYNLTNSKIIILFLALFIIMDGYHAIFNTSIKRLRQSKIALYRSIADMLFMLAFIIYYFIFLI